MGAKLITGGEVWNENPGFYRPTLLTEITADMPVFQEETFGPPVGGVVIPFDTVDEAIKIANNTAFGLGASIWSKDIEKAKKSRQSAGSWSCIYQQHHQIRSPPLAFWWHQTIRLWP